MIAEDCHEVFRIWPDAVKELCEMRRAAIRLVALTLVAAGCTTVPAWDDRSPEETRNWFLENIYGMRPTEAEKPKLSFAPIGADRVMMDGTAVRRMVRITYEGPYGTNSFDAVAFLPVERRPAPVFLLLCNRPAAVNIDPERMNKSEFWPAEEIVRRGYAAVAFYLSEIAPDCNTGNRNGVFACYEKPGWTCRQPDLWGTLSAWAWGASRVMDWLETVPEVDANRVAVVGHSRGGKTALLAGVTDGRFAMACINDSGCSGVKLNRMDLPKSEHIRQIYRHFPYWFCGNYTEWINREDEIPCDQHQWLALMAPRLVAVGSAEGDAWAGPQGEAEACRLARPAWSDPGKVDYHIRPGGHDLNLIDWAAYMDFADRRGWRK